MAEENTNVNASNDGAQTQVDTKNKPDTNTDTKTPSIEQLIQSAVDRATQKLGTANKELREQLENLQKEKLSADELKEMTIKQKEDDIAKREAALKDKENRLFAIKAIKEAGLDDGSDLSLQLVDLVMGEDEKTITAKTKVFSTLVKKLVDAEVSKTFKENGRNPDKGASDKKTNDNGVASTLGKMAAEKNKAANDTLSYYMGGKK